MRAVREQSSCPLSARSRAAFSPGACGAASLLPQLRRTPRRPGSRPSPILQRSSPSLPGALSSRSSWEGGSNRRLLSGGVWGPRAELEESPSGASAAGGGAGARQRTWRLGPRRTRAGSERGSSARSAPVCVRGELVWGCAAPREEGEQRPTPPKAASSGAVWRKAGHPLGSRPQAPAPFRRWRAGRVGTKTLLQAHTPAFRLKWFSHFPLLPPRPSRSRKHSSPNSMGFWTPPH